MARRIAVTVVFALSVAACLLLARNSQSTSPVESGSGATTDIPWTSYPYPDPATGPEGDDFVGRVINVVEGDLIDVVNADGATVRVRLLGVDCPEGDQPFGNAAKEFMGEAIGGQQIYVTAFGTNSQGWVNGEIYAVDHAGNKDTALINLLLVNLGLAWHDVQNAPSRTDLADAEAICREHPIGLWKSDHEPIPPWRWRTMTDEQRQQAQQPLSPANEKR